MSPRRLGGFSFVLPYVVLAIAVGCSLLPEAAHAYQGRFDTLAPADQLAQADAIVVATVVSKESVPSESHSSMIFTLYEFDVREWSTIRAGC